MTMTGKDTHGGIWSDPVIVSAILNQPITLFLARLLLVGAYLIGGFTNLMDWPTAVAEQAHFGIPLPAIAAALTIFIELAGSTMGLTNRLAWLGAAMLGTFTVLAAFIANPFWMLHGQEQFAASNAFFEHIGLAGAFLLAAILAARLDHAAT